VTFYQFGDAKDNDGDGCVDEELLDGKDNDGDSFTDEDARISPLDALDNDRNGRQDASDADEVPALLDPAAALPWTKASGYVKGPKYADKAAKTAAQKDSLSAKLIGGRTLSAGEQAALGTLKTDIGGCWTNY
jgi:hypothetical protein